LSDQTELKIVNFINICFEIRFVYELMTTELFIDKDVSKTDETLHDEYNFLMKKIKYKMYRVTSCFNRVIELNQKMLILSKCLTKNYFYVIKITELLIKYFCNIKLCCL
jgi:hypothetical protein